MIFIFFLSQCFQPLVLLLLAVGIFFSINCTYLNAFGIWENHFLVIKSDSLISEISLDIFYHLSVRLSIALGVQIFVLNFLSKGCSIKPLFWKCVLNKGRRYSLILGGCVSEIRSQVIYSRRHESTFKAFCVNLRSFLALILISLFIKYIVNFRNNNIFFWATSSSCRSVYFQDLFDQRVSISKS
jgi:hypothetical protein